MTLNKSPVRGRSVARLDHSLSLRAAPGSSTGVCRWGRRCPAACWPGRQSRCRRMSVPFCAGIPGPNKRLLKLLSHPQWGSSLPPVLLPLLVPVRHQLTDTLSALLASNEQLWRGHSLCSGSGLCSSLGWGAFIARKSYSLGFGLHCFEKESMRSLGAEKPC